MRRARTTSESLLSIVLLLEAILIFFVMLVAYGLRVLPVGIVFGGGAALIVLLLLDGRVVGRQWGLAVGWALQVVLVLLGILLPLMYFIGAVFLLLWLYCYLAGRRIDRARAEFRLNNPTPS